ncbi:hypothetical protein PHG31p19 [Aeromonas phage 31]|uniref:Uncharacterized protein PHG31ORF020c n=1 Tax=Aeromonas phage 31 TaxID=321023 RepID=Q56EZ2_9CAUD|nr:hypothetical protein PHG31p19 [Aeromonas phage 31]AAX63508.1 hypothetical protein PHG31p19 [Aeromonas phage 31]
MRIAAFRKGGTNPVLLNFFSMTEGVIQNGYVENGSWEFSRVDGILCIEGDKEHPIPDFEHIVEVPDEMAGDYNEIISWAEKQLELK